MTVKRYQQTEKIFSDAATFTKTRIDALLKIQPVVTIALCGGRSAAAFCEHLRKLQISWNQIHVFMLDERLVSISDNESNFKIIKESLVEPLGTKFPHSNAHPFIYNSGANDEGTTSYEEELCSVTDRFDIIVGSAGEDGHIGALYPHHPMLKSEECFVTFHDSPKPPKDRMTCTPPMIAYADSAVLFFVGDSKKDALKKFNDNNLLWTDCPSKLVLEVKNRFVATDIK